MSVKRKLLIAGGGIGALLVIGAAVLWVVKPWLPDIVFSDPGPTGRRIVEDGVFANYFPAMKVDGPGVLMIGGSEGGIGTNVTRSAIDLQSRGFSVLAASYFGAPLYEDGLEKGDEHPDAAIAVERIVGDVLLVCGELDNLWPSCPMARQLDSRAAEAGRPSLHVLAYEQAGHRVFGLPEPPESQSLQRWGGDPAANNAAREDAWPTIVEFLRAQLRPGSGGSPER